MGDISYRNILVPIDERQMSKRVVDHALHVAEIESGNLIVIYVEDKKGIESIYPKELSEKMLAVVRENIEVNMGYAMAEAKKAGIAAEKIILNSDDIAGDLIRVAEEKNVDLTVMGSESLRRDPLGSLTRWIIAADVGPVLVITSED
ncbi:universal stress protein [Methanococcoides methylutens]|uniref:Universal stress protein n=1 Tax=Methanococcoides methylutens MM1 TaxID=1434104 RepID=A0A0E3X083_METMT|nr:universal stress protein [Methanococcoides methylutens]AKB85015.1 Universal stress protein [Methanococcoides methylutens MM1]